MKKCYLHKGSLASCLLLCLFPFRALITSYDVTCCWNPSHPHPTIHCFLPSHFHTRHFPITPITSYRLPPSLFPHNLLLYHRLFAFSPFNPSHLPQLPKLCTPQFCCIHKSQLSKLAIILYKLIF